MALMFLTVRFRRGEVLRELDFSSGSRVYRLPYGSMYHLQLLESENLPIVSYLNGELFQRNVSINYFAGI